MDDDWETAADKEVVKPPAPTNNNINKWKGEDDDEDVKDSWEDEEEKKDEEKPDTKTTTVPVKTKPNKTLKNKIEEQERVLDEEEERRLANMTPEEKLSEKLRMQKIQEESDLKSALDTFGVNNVAESLDSFNPQTKEEFKEFGATLSWKLSQYKESPHYPQFVDDLVRSICITLSAADIKKVKINVESLHSEKLKLEKQNLKKTVGKGKSKATLRTENNDITAYENYKYDNVDDDDFM